MNTRWGRLGKKENIGKSGNWARERMGKKESK
jgi:hypothetical protein